jgi:hypothetical protein
VISRLSINQIIWLLLESRDIERRFYQSNEPDHILLDAGPSHLTQRPVAPLRRISAAAKESKIGFRTHINKPDFYRP